MALADRVFDVVTHPGNLNDQVRSEFSDISDERKRAYWRCVLRMAALCHDMGHLPFSHAAEDELLPEGWTHEKITAEIIRSDILAPILKQMKLDPEDVVKIAVGPKELKKFEPDTTFSAWETILAEIIVGDAFGVDRMDYLLRDSHHTGVAYGHFDHYRLIDTLRILPAHPVEVSASRKEIGESSDSDIQADERDVRYALGVDQGGIQSAESMMLARYFMFSQVYLHHVRRIYDIHLKDFLKTWLTNGRFKTQVAQHHKITDVEVTSAILDAADDESKKGHSHARRIVGRQHFKVIYERNPADREINPESGKAVYEALCDKFGGEHFRHDRYSQKGGAPDFPVELRNGDITSSLAISKVLKDLPVVSIDYVFADREIMDRGEKWLKANKNDIIAIREEDNDGSVA